MWLELLNYGLFGLGTFGAAGWILWDNRRRRGNQQPLLQSLFWAIGAFFAAPLVLSAHLAQRPLLPGERREGGSTWQFCKNLAVLWTLYCFAIALMMMSAPAPAPAPQPAYGPKYEDVLAGVLVMAGVLFWLLPTAIISIVGSSSRKPHQVETGQNNPTDEG